VVAAEHVVLAPRVGAYLALHEENISAQPADAIAAIDLCVVPTQTFECLFAFVVLGHKRRQLLWFAVTRHPTAEWLAQIVEAFPWNAAPAYLVRDNDGAYGQAFRRRVRTMGIGDRPTSPRSPWQNSYPERLIGTLRRDCLDHVLIFGARHLRRMLTEYSPYYNESRTHLSLDKDAPLRRAGPAMRAHCRCAHSVWATSSLRADTIFGKDGCRSTRISASNAARDPAAIGMAQ
jgi:transposase InsO family protein